MLSSQLERTASQVLTGNKLVASGLRNQCVDFCLLPRANIYSATNLYALVYILNVPLCFTTLASASM